MNYLLDENRASNPLFKNDDDAKWAVNYFARIAISLTKIDDLLEEIKLILEPFRGRVNFVFRIPIPIEELILNVKMYLISWYTLTDLVAALINEVFDLGIHDDNISFGLIMKNKKVSGANIQKIFEKYERELEMGKFRRARNDVVHRGKLPDQEVANMSAERNEIFSKRYSLLEMGKISEADFEEQIKEWNSKLPQLINIKKEYYENHYNVTLMLISEIAEKLADVAFDQLTNKKHFIPATVN